MKVANIYIEYQNLAVDNYFTYICEGFSVEKGMRVEVNFANKNIIGFVWEVYELSEQEIKQYPYKLKSIIRVVDEKPFLNEELFSLAKWMSKRYVAPMISCLDAMLPSKLKPRSSFKEVKKEIWVVYKEYALLRGKKQQEALSYMMENKEVKRSSFNKIFPSQLDALIKNGCVTLIEKESESTFKYIYEDKSFTLSKEQQEAINTIQNSKGHAIHLLHGVTGSGKTEVFLQLAKQVIDNGKQVLFLVPEIGLTPQMIKRVSARFKEDIAIYHSSLNNQEKYEQYKLVYENKVKIVVGTRSSIFMPFNDLGLIIMDEEHDQSYKQDHTPKYHTKDVAIFRSKYYDCPLLLASATPSLETYARAIKKVYNLVEMPKRIHGEMPETILINMKDAIRDGESHILSNTLKEAIQNCLDKKEQCILLLNRRGYAPVLRCNDCGHVIKCPHCDIALNYHKHTNNLKCHVCGYQRSSSYYCESCNSKNISFLGMGTQKLEEYLSSVFKDANIIRMDVDTTTKKNAHEKLLEEFERNGDILLGTQMIAKGLDFERVTLVGILNGDALLNRVDYRSVELTFNLLVQASGRSGRKDLGKVMIQVYDDKHYAIQCAKNHDYKSFFKQEMRFRHIGNYPPYTYLGCIIVTHENVAIIKEDMKKIVNDLSFFDVYKLGPIELTKKMDQYRERIIIKSKDENLISEVLYSIYKKHTEEKRKTKIEIEVNPYMMD